MNRSASDLLPIIRSELSSLRVPGPSDRVYNDECVLSFDSPYSPGGLYVNLQSFLGYGQDHFRADALRTGCKLYLHEIWRQVHRKDDCSNDDAPTKLAIGVEGGFNTGPKYDVEKTHFLVVIENGETHELPLSDTDIPEFVRTICEAIIDHQGMRANMQVDTWQADQDVIESKYAANLEQLDNGKIISNNPKNWACEASGDTGNLWLNLSTGYIGGGRKHWDGSGGSGAALQHYIDTGKKYPLCVKLGTITPHGADVWSYAEDEDCLVKVPRLGEYLSHWGIDIMRLEKTERTLGEEEVAKNMTYDWSKILESGEDLETVTGPGRIGLTNIGSTCYMNSVLQVLFSIPEFQTRYYDNSNAIVSSLPENCDPTDDIPVQMSKIAVALLSDRYALQVPQSMVRMSSEEEPSAVRDESLVIAPRMLKHLVGRGHREFSSGRQQDASEYMQYLLDQVQRAERTALGTRIPAPPGAMDTPSVFLFELQQRYQCSITNMVRYVSGQGTAQNVLELPIPLFCAVNSDEVAQHRERKRKLADSSTPSSADNTEDQSEPTLVVPFEACLDNFFASEQVEYRNPALGNGIEPAPLSAALRTARFRNFPRYLMVKLGRYYVDSDWKLCKIDAEVPVPEHIDLSQYRCSGGLQDGEIEMPQDVSSSSTNATAACPVEADEGIVAQLMSMGFSENGSKRAALATHNTDADAAMGWVFAHMEDPDFNDPPASAERCNSASSPAVDANSLAMLTSFGYTEKQCMAALKATDYNVERAADWLFSHTDNIDAAVAEVEGNGSGGLNTEGTGSSTLLEQNDGEGKYTLQAIISHIGRNTDHGHYVCHIKKDGQWIFFNDDKVALSKSTPLSLGFMYLFKRDDNNGEI
mmetsp:Transcript_14362/g.21525  ORF Transcript_14362/g.21525 Transcript_14362/m.21525 type:complete len:869 (-) Transcript_14362:55-2661(-)|eukprot:CAMPEP_0185033994 /NCGR_PEP_ID=MMETSP1103-20130426/23461_1 /TAXON_ID=36769 /ORGANISM="Paraphysomonas bandaiensis, Strain Caron Lab Isolate" /LENGTH=868 /DNA_ID=CAMNT_0027570469 /DNA_START=23 /DNA_END=2629 /DNA_ORIENTATION=-